LAGTLLTCCSRGSDQPSSVHLTVVSIPKDSLRFVLPTRARYCDDGRSMLLGSASPLGNGILVRVRYGDSLTSGVYAVLSPSDTVSPRGATVGLRYMIRDVEHTLTMDSGGVEVRRGKRHLDVRASGWGLDRAVRVPVTAQYERVPILADTVQCRSEP
jgi:hypothetical protein